MHVVSKEQTRNMYLQQIGMRHIASLSSTMHVHNVQYSSEFPQMLNNRKLEFHNVLLKLLFYYCLSLFDATLSLHFFYIESIPTDISLGIFLGLLSTGTSRCVPTDVRTCILRYELTPPPPPGGLFCWYNYLCQPHYRMT